MSCDGLQGPSEVEEGTTGTIEIDAAGETEISVTLSNPSEEFVVDVDADGKARFKLPAAARAGTLLLIVGVDDPSKSHEIRIVPASGN